MYTLYTALHHITPRYTTQHHAIPATPAQTSIYLTNENTAVLTHPPWKHATFTRKLLRKVCEWSKQSVELHSQSKLCNNVKHWTNIPIPKWTTCHIFRYCIWNVFFKTVYISFYCSIFFEHILEVRWFFLLIFQYDKLKKKLQDIAEMSTSLSKLSINYHVCAQLESKFTQQKRNSSYTKYAYALYILSTSQPQLTLITSLKS